MNSFGKTIKIIVAVILLVIVLFLYQDIFHGQFSFSSNEEIEKLILEKENELEKIFQDNQDLKEEIKLIKNNEDHIKKIAEENLGLIKDDEKEPE